jgi:hypothetical protein
VIFTPREPLRGSMLERASREVPEEPAEPEEPEEPEVGGAAETVVMDVFLLDR